jgi:hypothetical protein
MDGLFRRDDVPQRLEYPFKMTSGVRVVPETLPYLEAQLDGAPVVGGFRLTHL